MTLNQCLDEFYACFDDDCILKNDKKMRSNVCNFLRSVINDTLDEISKKSGISEQWRRIILHDTDEVYRDCVDKGLNLFLSGVSVKKYKFSCTNQLKNISC